MDEKIILDQGKAVFTSIALPACTWLLVYVLVGCRHIGQILRGKLDGVCGECDNRWRPIPWTR
jgi:hypothetical protein